MSVLHANREAFEKLRAADAHFLVDFHAKWCGPCRMLSPILDELAESGVTILKIDVDEEPELAREFGVYSIPALFVLKKGEVIAHAIGLHSREELEEMLAR